MEEKKVNIFDFLKDLSWNKKYLLDNLNTKEYSPYLINQFLSYANDTAFIGERLNRMPRLSKKLHFLFCFFSLSKKRRFFSYPKKRKVDDLKYIMKYYNITEKHAMEYLELLNEEQIKTIKESVKEII